MYRKNIFVVIATLGLPKATPLPGTMASLATCVVLYFCKIVQFGIYIPAVAFLFACFVIERALRYFDEKDPCWISLDEVAGMLTALCYIKLSLFTIILGFFLFRLFDGLKLLGLKRVEKIPGALGVVLDDVVAGLFSNFVLQVLLCWLKII